MAVAGVVAVVLPGSTHKTATSSNSSSELQRRVGHGELVVGSGSSGSGTSNSRLVELDELRFELNGSGSSNSSNSSGNLQAPSYTPVQSGGGGGQITSGGS